MVKTIPQHSAADLDPFRYEVRPKLIKNAVKCWLCEEVIVSEWVHDFKTCGCKNISVDGDNYYARRLGSETSTNPETGEQTWADASEYEIYVIDKEILEMVVVLAPGEEVPPQYQRPVPVPDPVASRDADS